jgi:hypothetical protein
VDVRNAGGLAYTLAQEREQALLFRRLATLRTDIHLFDSVEELRWKGATQSFPALAERLDARIGAAPRLTAAARRG